MWENPRFWTSACLSVFLSGRRSQPSSLPGFASVRSKYAGHDNASSNPSFIIVKRIVTRFRAMGTGRIEDSGRVAAASGGSAARVVFVREAPPVSGESHLQNGDSSPTLPLLICRQLTGLYPEQRGAQGFDTAHRDVPRTGARSQGHTPSASPSPNAGRIRIECF